MFKLNFPTSVSPIVSALSIVSIVCMLGGCTNLHQYSKHADESRSFSVKVMSFNIAGDMDDDNGEWQQRMHEVANVIASEKPDVIGFQEAYLGNFAIIQGEVPGYAFYGLNEKGNADVVDGIGKVD